MGAVVRLAFVFIVAFVTVGLLAAAVLLSMRSLWTGAPFAVAVAWFVGRWWLTMGWRAFGTGPQPPPLVLQGPAALKKPMTIVFVSDTHCTHDRIRVPDAEVFVHCGDSTRSGTAAELASFGAWLRTLPHRVKILIPGNHDLTLDGAFYRRAWASWHAKEETDAPGRPTAERLLPLDETGVHYLVDEGVTIEGVRFFAMPWMPRVPVREMAYNQKRDGPELGAAVARIPDDTDVLITHGPPGGIQDSTVLGTNAGCALLRARVDAVRPIVHAFGHIHEGYGVTPDLNGTAFVNAASVNILHAPWHRPVVVTLVPPAR